MSVSEEWETKDLPLSRVDSTNDQYHQFRRLNAVFSLLNLGHRIIANRNRLQHVSWHR